MKRIRRNVVLMATFTLFFASSACSPVGANERLWVTGELDREGIYQQDDGSVEVEYLSETSRGEWWPCDLRVTAAACVDDHHVNAYIGLPQITDLEGLGRADCVQDGVPYGVYELFDSNDGGQYSVGSELALFVVIASDSVSDVPGAELTDDRETTAASRFTSGTLTVTEFGRVEDNLAFVYEGETSQGRTAKIEFHGPMNTPGVVPTLEGPNTCVDNALVE